MAVQVNVEYKCDVYGPVEPWNQAVQLYWLTVVGFPSLIYIVETPVKPTRRQLRHIVKLARKSKVV